MSCKLATLDEAVHLRWPALCNRSNNRPLPCYRAAAWTAQRRADQRRRRTELRCTAAIAQAEGWLQGLAELFGSSGDDPGHWNFSPEWWGSQGGGWGRDAGTPVFEADSSLGNGRISVTAHPTSISSRTTGPPEEFWEEWRVLRFNSVTRQSVARVTVRRAAAGSDCVRRQLVQAHPDCLAQEYQKTTAAVAAALLRLQRLLPPAAGGGRLRALCLGVGGGSLPHFLAHHFECMGGPLGAHGCAARNAIVQGTVASRPAA